MSETKQVIVIRKDLKMRRGKEIAQGAHASMMWLSKRVQEVLGDCEATIDLSAAEEAWITGVFAKVTCQVSSEEELMELYRQAYAAGLEANLVFDAGRTEFHGEPTLTALAIGPDYEDRIDPITEDLILY